MPRFGVATFPTDYGFSVVDLAKAVEERGFDAIFFNFTRRCWGFWIDRKFHLDQFE
jgi:hypothetical protein